MNPETQKKIDPECRDTTKVNWWTHLVVTLVILMCAFGLVAYIVNSGPVAPKNSTPGAVAVAVEAVPLRQQSYRVWINSFGTVRAMRHSELMSEVAGKVVWISDNIRPGQRFTEGEVLLRLDDTEFEINLNIAAAEVASAQLDYTRELAQVEYAGQQWNQLPETDAARRLALREPQVAAAKAQLQAAQARLRKARIDLQRTRITAPFDGKILQQNIELGQVVDASELLASIYSTAAAEVRLPVKVSDLAHLPLDTLPDKPMEVVLETEMGNTTHRWKGKIVRSEDVFDSNTRMLFLVARIENPFITNSRQAPMRVGQFVKARIQGREYAQVFVLPRKAVSQASTVGIAHNDRLQKRQVQPIWSDQHSIVVSAVAAHEPNSPGIELAEQPQVEPLCESDWLVVTPTSKLPNDTPLRIVDVLSNEVPVMSETKLSVATVKDGAK